MSINSMFVEESLNNKQSVKRLETKVDELSNRLEKVSDMLESTNDKLDKIMDILNVDVKEKCDKMGEHIDFIENVYDNVKNPLGYLCNKLNSFTNGSTKYTLEDFECDDSDYDYGCEDHYENEDECENEHLLKDTTGEVAYV